MLSLLVRAVVIAMIMVVMAMGDNDGNDAFGVVVMTLVVGVHEPRNHSMLCAGVRPFFCFRCPTRGMAK